MLSKTTIALVAGISTGLWSAVAMGASTIWSASGAISGYTTGFGSDHYSWGWTYPGQPVVSLGDVAGGYGEGFASSGLQMFSFGKLIALKGTSSCSAPGHASSSFTANFTVDFDGVFSLKATGDGRIDLTGTVSYHTDDFFSEFHGFLPAGTYTVTGSASNGSYEISVPTPGCVTTAAVGFVFAAARRRRLD